MAKPPPEQQFRAIEAVVSAHPAGVSSSEIRAKLSEEVAPRTLQHRLKLLVDLGRIIKEGERRWTKYRLPDALTSEVVDEDTTGIELRISKEATEILEHVRKPIRSRKPVGYERAFLERYQPNITVYLSKQERVHLNTIGNSSSGQRPAGTYARQILNRLLIDLSWNSSRLEGNTYSILDTKRLIEFGEEAEGRQQIEAQMILNHKDAIEFLVGSVEEIGFNRHTVLNLHALLSNNLLADPDATGRLRRIPVGIEGSAFYPLEVPQIIEECFDQILATATAINDPFEQAFFSMVQFPYLQPFDDVNKRVSRLVSNIPFIQSNLIPLSFTDVPVKTYTEAILGVYELNRIELLKDVFIWAYERSVSKYTAVRQSLGVPDPFRLKYRSALRDLIKSIVQNKLGRKDTFEHISIWAGRNIEADDQERFRQIVEDEISNLHAGNFARYQIKPSEFALWQKGWE